MGTTVISFVSEFDMSNSTAMESRLEGGVIRLEQLGRTVVSFEQVSSWLSTKHSASGSE